MWQHRGKVTVGLVSPKNNNLKTMVLLVRGAASLLPQSLGLYLEPEFISLSSPTSGSRRPTHETASITVTEAEVWSYRSTATGVKQRLQKNILYCRTHCSLFVRGGRERRNSTPPPHQNRLLSLFVPHAQLFLRDIVGEVVAFAAALDATLVAGGFARAVPAAAVLE